MRTSNHRPRQTNRLAIVSTAAIALLVAACGATNMLLGYANDSCYKTKSGSGCKGLGDDYMGISVFAQMADWSHTVDAELAKRAYVAGCDLGDTGSCGRLLALGFTEGDAALEQRVKAKVGDGDPGEDLRHDVAQNALNAAKIDARLAEEHANDPSTFQLLAQGASLTQTSLKFQASVPGAGSKAAGVYASGANAAGNLSDYARKLDAVTSTTAASRARLSRATRVTFPEIPMPAGALDDPACNDKCMNAVYFCKNGVARGCEQLGELFLRGEEGVAQNPVLATKVLQATCDANPRVGCFHLAAIYDQGLIGVRRDRDRALALYKRACSVGGPSSVPACGDVPLLEQQSSINAPPIPPALLDDPVCGQYPTCSTVRALCAVGHPDACQTLADVYREGSIPGVPKDPTRGLALLETICNSDAKLGCPRLAEAYEKGQGVPVDKARAMTLLKRACEGGDGTACYLVWDRGDKAFGAAHMESGCEAKDLMSCLGLRSVPGMLPRALAAVQALCSAGDKAACGYIHH